MEKAKCFQYVLRKTLYIILLFLKRYQMNLLGGQNPKRSDGGEIISDNTRQFISLEPFGPNSNNKKACARKHSGRTNCQDRNNLEEEGPSILQRFPCVMAS